MFFDEPTRYLANNVEYHTSGCDNDSFTHIFTFFINSYLSGLDSFMAMSIVECIRRLAHDKGKTIICTIHQPSSDVFEKFDRLCLLAEGRLAYMGDLRGAKEFFAGMSYPIPENYNPADHYINTLAVVPSEVDESKAKIDIMCDKFAASDLNARICEEIKGGNDMKRDDMLNLNLTSKIRLV